MNNREYALPIAFEGKRKSQRISQNTQTQNVNIAQIHCTQKTENVKRSPLADFTNNADLTTTNCALNLEKYGKQHMTFKKCNYQNEEILKVRNLDTIDQLNQSTQHKVTTRPTAKNLLIDETNKINTSVSLKDIKSDTIETFTTIASNITMSIEMQDKLTPRRISNDFKVQIKGTPNLTECNNTENSLYKSTLENDYISSTESVYFSASSAAVKGNSELQLTHNSENDLVSLPYTDFDQLNCDDPFAVSYYAKDIFSYLKEYEQKFLITDYMIHQVNLTKWMRSQLIDWIVKVQELFKLYDETLYLTIKIVDLYLCRVIITKHQLKLLGAVALLIASKYNERSAPLVKHLLFVCGNTYECKELIKMEKDVLKAINYSIGIPLSYTFLRRYARCAKVRVSIIILACYILELSLMVYETITFRDSQMAAASLFMALRMFGEEKAWTSMLEYYSGYKLEELAGIVVVINEGIHRIQKTKIKTIRSKYSRQLFLEVAKTPLMTTEKLFENNLDFQCGVYLDNI